MSRFAGSIGSSCNINIEKSPSTGEVDAESEMLKEVWLNMDNRERREGMNAVMSSVCKIAPTPNFELPQESSSACWQLINQRIGKGRYLHRGPMSFIGDVKQTLMNVKSSLNGDGDESNNDQQMASKGLEELPDIIRNAFKLGNSST